MTMTYKHYDLNRRQRDGYRYVRQYETRPYSQLVRGETRWQLWERQNGRMRRVGTAYSNSEVTRFLMREQELAD